MIPARTPQDRLTASMRTLGGEVILVVEAGHFVDHGHPESVKVHYDCCIFVLYGDDRSRGILRILRRAKQFCGGP